MLLLAIIEGRPEHVASVAAHPCRRGDAVASANAMPNGIGRIARRRAGLRCIAAHATPGSSLRRPEETLDDDAEMLLRMLIELEVSADTTRVRDSVEQTGNAERAVVDLGTHC